MVKNKYIFPQMEISNIHSQYVLELENVYVYNHGLILDEQFELIPEANLSSCYWHSIINSSIKFQVGSEIRDHISQYDITSLSENAYVYALHYFNGYVFGHFWDVVQPLQKIEYIGLTDKILLSCVDTNAITDLNMHWQQCDYINVKALNLYDSKILIKIPHLYYSSPVGYPAHISKASRQWLIRKYSNLGRRDNYDILYFSRNPGGKIISRSAVNHLKIIDILNQSKHSYKIIEGIEPFKDIISYVRGAKLIFGVHGSMFWNILFSEYAKLKVVEFCPNDRICTSLFELGKDCGFDYVWKPVSSIDDKNNIEIDIDYLQRVINEL